MSQFEVVRIQPFNSDNAFRGFIDIKYGPVLIKCRVIALKDGSGVFASMPSRKNQKTGDWSDEVIIDGPARDSLEKVVSVAWNKAAGQPWRKDEPQPAATNDAPAEQEEEENPF